MHRSTSFHPTHTPGRAAALRSAIALAVLLALAGSTRAEAQGGLVQRTGPKGCVSHDGDARCTDADLLSGAFSVAVSGDGRHAYVAAIEADAVAVLARNARTGALTQLPPPLGCVSDDGSNGLCTVARGLYDPVATTVSPDGRNVYVVAHQRDPVTITGIVLFARDAKSGTLTQLPGTQGCISEVLPPEECTPAVGLRGARSLAVSGDGRHVYVAAEADSVAIFARDPETGALTQLPEPHGCVSQTGNGGRCTVGRALDAARDVVVSGDGRHVYVASGSSHAVAAFVRNKKTGALTQRHGEAGCIALDGTAEGCAQAAGLGAPYALALSPNGKTLYVTSWNPDQLAVLARSKKSGALRGVECFVEGGSADCDAAIALQAPVSVAVSPDGRRVYVAARDRDGIAVFARTGGKGNLAQLPGAAGCITEDGLEGACADGRALRLPREVTVSADGKHVYVAAQTSSAVAVLEPK